MNITEAIKYFRDAEEMGFYSPTAQELSMLSEGEIIGLAEDLADKGDNYYDN